MLELDFNDGRSLRFHVSFISLYFGFSVLASRRKGAADFSVLGSEYTLGYGKHLGGLGEKVVGAFFGAQI